MEGITLPSFNKLSGRNEVRVSQSGSRKSDAASSSQAEKQSSTVQRKVTRCYNCGGSGHIATECLKPKREKGACFICGTMAHQAKECPNKKRTEKKPSDQVSNIAENGDNVDEYRRMIRYQVCNKFINLAFSLDTQIDCGSPISFIKESLVPNVIMEKVEDISGKYNGINESKLQIIGTTRMNITVGTMYKENLLLYVVTDITMRCQAIFGRDLMKEFGMKLIEPEGTLMYIDTVHEIMNIDISEPAKDKVVKSLVINSDLSNNNKMKLQDLFKTKYLEAERPREPKVEMKMTLKLRKHDPFHFKPRRLAYAEKLQLQKLIDDLLAKEIIRVSESEYASPIVLVRKKTGEMRLCIDYRMLNKYIITDNYPLPIIEDQINALNGKKYYTNLDLKDGFHQIKVDENAIKYTAFTTPIGQYEYLGMPFGLKIATARFTRYVTAVLREVIDAGNVIVYVDDFLVASKTVEEHLEILGRIFELLVENKLELRIDKCRFLMTKIDYLGYTIEGDTIKPMESGIIAVKKYPIPQNRKDIQSFIGLASYFRKFIEGFSLIAAPLYKLLKKNVDFKFGEVELNAFITLKDKLIQGPVLGLYSPHDETELHTDASAVGFGAVLLQRKSDKKLHPIFYFSKRASESESKYHSFELETLAIIYALKRFRIYLYGISFKIVTDCNALKLTLQKREVNSRIERWAIELLAYDYTTEHRPGVRMQHVDAFSRVQNILVVEANSLDINLAISQSKDRKIIDLREKLEKNEDSLYEMRGGIIYRKARERLLFYVPECMENQVINKYHDEMGHMGSEKTCNAIQQNYYFPKLTSKVKEYIQNCLTCIAYKPNYGKTEGRLQNIPKGDKPFRTLHIDHYGPIDKQRRLKQYILLIVDGFTKFVKLYATKSTTSREAIDCLEKYFNDYSRPKAIVSDRGTCFTSLEFKEFMSQNNIKHILIATAAPRANGQAERINRILGPMLGKLIDNNTGKYWYKTLAEVEYALNNSINKSTGETASKLLFGVKQRGKIIDGIAEYLEENVNIELRDLDLSRKKARQNIIKLQEYNKSYYDKCHKTPLKYETGDYVMIKNFETKAGVSKKTIPRMKGPYEVTKVLRNDRYLIRGLDEIEGASGPYEGTWSADNMRPWRDISNTSENESDNDDD